MTASRFLIKNLKVLSVFCILTLSFSSFAQTDDFDDFNNAPPLTQDPLADDVDDSDDDIEPDDLQGPDARKGFWGFFGTNLGYSTFLSQQTGEADKDGFQLDLKALVAWDLGDWVLDLGAGWFYNRLEGSPSGTPITITTRAGFIEFTPHYRLSDSWNIALVNNVLIGTDTTFDEGANTDTKIRLMSGLRLSYEIPTDSTLLRVGGQFLTDVNIQNRQIMWVQLDLQIGIPFSGQDLEAAAQVRPPKIYDVTDTIRVTGEKSVQVTLGEESVYFKTGRREPDRNSTRFLKRFGQFLVDNEDDWNEIRVEGHTDSRGSQSFNEKLSFQRAANVREALIGVGVKTDKITAKGFGPNDPVDPKNNEEAWAKNRRVELRFSGVEDPAEFAEKLKQFRRNP